MATKADVHTRAALPCFRKRFQLDLVTLLAAALLFSLQEAHAQERDRSGKEVVEAFCAACHETGTDNAPRIGDVEAWRGRASLGLTRLTRHTLEGIRQMPAHGGNPELTDLAVARAIAYMVNASGGNWVEPVSESEIMEERTGEDVVKMQCAQCHESGEAGAPQIGDRNAWILRLQHGLHYAVRSAIMGHGGMPPRGGAANLTDAEIRNAILYMFNPEATAAPRSARGSVSAQTSPMDANHVRVGGMDVYLGVISADQLRSYPPESVERSMHGGIPSGDNWYHVNVSLLDQELRAPITGAQVDVRVEEVGISMESRRLQPMAIGQGSYGNYFRMTRKTPYRVIVSLRTSGSPAAIEVEFQRRHD